MGLAATEDFDELVLEVETTTPGTYTKICGIVDVTVTRTANMDQTEVPDCDDESLPLAVQREVRNLEVSVTGTGVWAVSSNKIISDWFYSGAKKNVRITNAKAAAGDPEVESGGAFLTQYNQGRTKGQKVSAEVTIVFDGTPTRANAS